MRSRKAELALLCACSGAIPAQAGSVPEWVESGKLARYPRTLYLAGVGMGASGADAEGAALGALAKQIEANITTASQSTMSSSNENVESYFHQNVEVKTSEQIQGAQFAERFHQEDGTWAVLAVVKIDDLISRRERSARTCLGELLAPAGKGGASETFKRSVTVLVKSRECDRRLQAFHAAEALQSSAAKAAQEDGGLGRMETQARERVKGAGEALTQLTFSTACVKSAAGGGEEPPSRLCEDFEKVLVDFGLGKAEAAPALELRLKYETEEKPAGGSKLVFVRSRFTVEILDRATKAVFFKDVASSDGGGASLSSAVGKADKKIMEQVVASFTQIFMK
jgi:hypothetical protein